MTESQKFFIILYSLKRGLVKYNLNENILSKSYILENRTYFNNNYDFIEEVNLETEINSLKSICDIFRVSSILAGITGSNFELDFMTPFGNFNVPATSGHNDLDLILDFWYDEPDIFQKENEYRDLLLHITRNFDYLKSFKYRVRSKQVVIKSNPIWKYRELGEVSSKLIFHIEETLGKPNFNLGVNIIIDRLEKQNRTSLPLELSLSILKLNSNNEIFAWPEKIVDKEIIKQLAYHYSK
jgi:hypothetical protein